MKNWKFSICIALLFGLAATGISCLQPVMPKPQLEQVNTPLVAQPVQIFIDTENTGPVIPPDFIGLSFDAPLLADKYFSNDNQQLINLFTNLGKGVISFGANGLERTYWPRTWYSRFLHWNAHAVLSPEDIDRVFGFVRETGWKVIFGLNLGANNAGMAADLAAYAASVGGDSILAFEIGNEPDLFYRNGVRRPDYGYENYHDEFSSYVKKIRERVPAAPIAGPVTASRFSWFSSFLKDEAANIVLATNHYYPLNADPAISATDPLYASIENLMSPDTAKRATDIARQYAAAAAASGVPARFDETNTSYPFKNGLGNTFASALWGADYLFNLAEQGISGANFFGGFNSPSYSPIYMTTDGNGNSRYYAAPLYYGMLLFQGAAEGRTVSVIKDSALNVSAHAILRDDGILRVVIINKDASQPITAQIRTLLPYYRASAVRLSAGSLESVDGITLAGSSVNDDGTWYPKVTEKVILNGTDCEVMVPAASAVAVTLK